jgi:hypothetical protein
MSFMPQPLYFGGRNPTPGTQWIGVGKGTAGLEAVARTEILCPRLELNSGRPARSQSLYCLSYPGSSKEWLDILKTFQEAAK